MIGCVGEGRKSRIMHRLLCHENSWIILAYTVPGRREERTGLKRKVMWNTMIESQEGRSGLDSSDSISKLKS